MELKITIEEAEKILLAWAQTYFKEGQFDKVKIDLYSYSKQITFTKEESKDATQ